MSATKIVGNITNILNCSFRNKFTLWQVRLNICICKTKFTCNKQYYFRLLFSTNAKKTHTDQSILQAFLLCLRINVLQTFKSSSCKNVFPKFVYHWYNLLRWIFSIPFGYCKQYFLLKFIVTQRLGVSNMLLCYFKQVFWKKSAFYTRYLHNNITIMLTTEVQNKVSTA